jgi:hypothetical protein
MSCNCTTITPLSPDGECLPTVEADCAITKNVTVCKSCPSDNECLKSDQSDGTTLASSWTDAGCYAEGVTILGRVGSKLARFAGSGFIALENGIASVVQSVPLRVSTIWHRWWKPTPASVPVLGDPLAYPYGVVADSNGDLHAIKGPADEDATPVWDSTAKEFTQKPLSEVALDRKGVLLRANNIELVGYAPIVEAGDPKTVRPMRALNGAGLVVLTEAVTVDPTCECAPGAGTASKASTLSLPVPVADEVYILKYSTASGLHWAEEV